MRFPPTDCMYLEDLLRPLNATKAKEHRRGSDLRYRPSLYKTQLKNLLAVFASVTAIIFLILVCSSVRSRTHSRVATRKLSTDGDLSDSGSDHLVICEESGEETTDHSNPQSPLAPLKPPDAKKARVEAGEKLGGAQSSFEEKSKSESDDDDQPSTSAGRRRKRRARAAPSETSLDEDPQSPTRSEAELEAASALLALQEALAATGEGTVVARESRAGSPPTHAPIHGPTPSAGASQMSAPTLLQVLLQPIKTSLPFASAVVPTPPSAPSSAATPGGEGTASQMSVPIPLKLLLQPVKTSLPFASAVVPSTPSAPSSAATPGGEGTASQMSAPTLLQLLLQPVKTSSPSASAVVPSTPSAPSFAARLGADGTSTLTSTLAVSASSVPSSDGEQPSTSSAAGASAAASRLRVHPYYRVPRVDPTHRGVKRFKPELATHPGVAFTNICSQLKRMRRLLVQEALGPLQLGELSQATTELLSSVYHFERTSTREESPSAAARILGRRFLELDVIIAALQLLEVPACGQWWNRIVDVIPDDTLALSSYFAAHADVAECFHIDLVKRLHSALRTLKTGARLPEGETIQLKRKLFCSRHSPSNFKVSTWDIWRADDREFALCTLGAR
ncbi:hypothetical protein Esti_004584 [Eimeria stiedai]